MTAVRVLPLVMVALSIGAAVMYAAAGDLRRGVYWIAAAVLTLAVTL